MAAVTNCGAASAAVATYFGLEQGEEHSRSDIESLAISASTGLIALYTIANPMTSGTILISQVRKVFLFRMNKFKENKKGHTPSKH